MMRKRSLHVLLLSTGLLGACGDDGFTSIPVTVTAQSGGKVELTGTWKSACYLSGSKYVIDVRSYNSNGRMTGYTENYNVDPSCTTLDSTDTYATDVRIIVGDDKTAAGWTDGNGTTGATVPNDTSGSALPATPTVSKYSFTMDNSTPVKSIDLIDDSTSSWVMFVADSNVAVGSDGYHEYLANVHPLSKQ